MIAVNDYLIIAYVDLYPQDNYRRGVNLAVGSTFQITLNSPFSRRSKILRFFAVNCPRMSGRF